MIKELKDLPNNVYPNSSVQMPTFVRKLAQNIADFEVIVQQQHFVVSSSFLMLALFKDDVALPPFIIDALISLRFNEFVPLLFCFVFNEG